MNVSSGSEPVSTKSLSERIAAAEQRLFARRDLVATKATQVRRRLFAGLVSPNTLLTGFAIGIALQRGMAHRRFSIMALISAINTWAMFRTTFQDAMHRARRRSVPAVLGEPATASSATGTPPLRALHMDSQ